MQERKISTASKLFTILLALCFTSFLLEIGCRAYNVVEGFSFLETRWNPIGKERLNLIPFRQFGFTPYEKIDQKNVIADRHGRLAAIEKPDSIFRIVCFGGSSSENGYSYKRTKTTYPILLEKKLKKRFPTQSFEVLNMAYSGYSTAHSLISLELDVLNWQPDLVILSHNINDLSTNYFPKPAFDYSSKYGHSYYLPDYKNNYTTTNVLFQWSQFYWWLKKELKQFEQRPEKMRIRKHRYGKNLPPLAKQNFERNVSSFIHLAKGNDIPVLLGTQALRRDSMSFVYPFMNKTYNSEVEYPYLEEFWAHHDSLNLALKKVGKQLEVPVADNATAFANNTNLLVDCVHYSAEGVDFLAELYADFISKSMFKE